MKNFKMMLLLLVPLFLIGCVNYSEETWLNSNGSGKMSMEISISEQFVAMMTQEGSSNPFSQKELAKPFKGVKGIKLGEVKTYHKDGNQVVAMNFEFESLKALQNVKSSDGTPGFLGKITFTKNKQGQMVFKRTIEQTNMGQSDPTEQTDSENGLDSDLQNQMSAAMFSGYYWKYTVHFPSKLINATTDTIDKKTNTVVWEIPLSDLSTKSHVMTATIEAPMNWSIIIIIAAAFVFIAALVVVILKFTKKPAKLEG